MLEVQSDSSVAKPPLEQRRRTPRYPFVAPIAMQSGDSSQTVLTHDISRGGLGFYSSESLAGRVVAFELPTVLGRTVGTTARVIWSRQCSRDWFINGAELLTSTNVAWVEIRIAAAASGFKRRQTARKNLFEPVRIQYPSTFKVTHAQSRDISPNGIGLFHTSAPISESAIISSEQPGIQSELRARLVWSKQYDDRFFMSGWELKRSRLMLEEL